jgi:hypothetical protein
MSASWGEDDMWDVAARYAGEHHGFKIAVAAAYAESTDENTVGIENAGDFPPAGHRDASYFQIGAYVQHVATGLFLYGAYGTEEVDHNFIDPLGDGAGGENFGVIDPEHWYLKAGIRTKCTPLGATVFYGEYAEYQDQLSATMVDALNITGAGGSELQLWGLGVVQEIDAAAMSIWLHYRNIEGDVQGSDTFGNVNFGDLDLLKFGALINF